MGRRRKLINKEAFKKFNGKCYFCPETNYAALDCHQIIPGTEGGTYGERNVVPCCSSCHRKIHNDIIIIDKKYLSTSGQMILHYWKDGVEHWD